MNDSDKVLFTKGAKREAPLGEAEGARLPSRVEVEKTLLASPAGTYTLSTCKNWLYLKPYSGKQIAIPIHRAQTYIETERQPVDPFAS